MEKSQNLRKILAQNIRNARASLHISQAKLAEYASISFPHMHDIEYCKTWVSDKTLGNIAKALNVEPYELLIPNNVKETDSSGKDSASLKKTAQLINAKKRELRKKTGDVMDDLILEIVKTYGNKG